jgi:hypothetical protein
MRARRHLTAAIAIALALAFSQASTAQAEDTTPPAAPAIWLEHYGWQPSPDFEIGWMDHAEQETPIEVVHYELCFYLVCYLRQVMDWEGKGTTGHQRFTVTVPNGPPSAFGEYKVRIWLEDGAGNVNPSMASDVVTLGYDAADPRNTRIYASNDWLSAAEAHFQIVTLELDGSPPDSGIAGWATTRDGSLPGTSVDTESVYSWGRTSLVLDDLAEGSNVLKARAISRAGVPAPDVSVGFKTLRVDRTSPSISATSAANLAAWQSGAVTLGLKAVDQLGLSGMDPAPFGEPVTDGGHIAYTIDGGPPQLVRGDDADLTIDIDGSHTVGYAAYDLAGNDSGEKAVQVRVDGTPPTAAFEQPPVDDPRRLEVVVRDAASGISDGQIEMRRTGAGTYRALDTRLEAGRLVAQLDDDVPDGRYELRARVRDRAGNETVSSDRVGGDRMTVTLPIRTPTRLQLETAARPVGHRVRPLIRGRLTTSGGQPLAKATVTVLDRDPAGGDLRPIGSVETNAKGRFRHRALARRPSRAIRYSYAGTRTIRPAFRDVAIRVRAGLTLSVNRTWLLNGQSVVFSGRLRGRPLPRDGKLIALQAKRRGSWTTFGVPRVNRRGAFKLRYRFTATTGLRKYRFRALAAKGAGYPYETGASRGLVVTVRGL